MDIWVFGIRIYKFFLGAKMESFEMEFSENCKPKLFDSQYELDDSEI